MTARLLVRIECGAVGEARGAVLTRVVGNIYGTTPDTTTRRDVALPVGWDTAPAVFDLPAGGYLVEAALPSGELLSEQVEARDGPPTTVVLEVTRSPFESHTMQYLLGNIEPGAVYHSPTTYPVPASVGSQSFFQLESAALPPQAGPPAAEVAILRRTLPGPLPTAVLADARGLPAPEAVERVRAALGPPADPVVLSADHPDPLAPIYRLDEGLRLRRPDVAWSRHEHQYLVVAAAGDAYLVTAPWPWPSPDGRPVGVEVMVNLRQAPTGSPVSVVVRDPAVGGGLGYLAEGSLEKAAVLLGDVESMLFAKRANPIAAAAGGYVLVGTDHGTQRQDWDPWLENLWRWFPGLSDGAVLWATRRLRGARTEDDVDGARAALLEGYRRGLPVFTLGLTWLLDGLARFPDDPECAAAAAQVQRLSWLADMREPFVVLRLGGPR